MSLPNKNKHGIPNTKDLAKNVADTSGLTDQVNQKISDLTSSVSQTLNKAGETVSQVTNTLNEAQDKAGKIKQVSEEITGLDTGSYGFSNYQVIPHEQWLKQSGINSILASYGGDPEKDLANSHIVYSKIYIAGEQVLKNSHFVLTIRQKVACHDEFEILCSSDAVDNRNAYPMEQAKNYLGKKATLQLIQFGQPAYLFTGIITDITNTKNNGDSQLIISGKSPTILLENGMDCQSFEKQSLKEVIQTATTEYSGLLEWDIRPNLETKLLYTVQYRESDWDFIKRLATRYGEWFYYNGQQLVFGGYGGKTIELVEEQDIYNFKLKMQLVPQKFSYVSYNAKQAREHTVDSESVPLSHRLVNPFQQHAIKASEEVFSKVPLSLYNQSLLESGEMEVKEAVKRQKLSRQNVFFMEARTNNPNIRPGDIVKMKAWMPGHQIFKNGEVPLESYRIIEINHYQDITEGYYNEIVGVPKDNFVPPYMDEDAIPECEEQSAIVMDNNDKEGLSRIRVQFPWQKPFNGMTPWIRSITPYAGSGKGMHVVPEIGEEVIVSFENGNAEKPVSLGAMFNGSGKSGHGGAGNYMKGLQTAAGSNLTFNDQKGDMTLADKGGASMKFDGVGNATTNANQTHAVNAGTNANTSVGGDASTLKMDDAGNITLEGNTNITLKVGANTIVIDQNGLTFTNKDGNSVAITPDGISNMAKTGKVETTTEAGDIKMESKANDVSIKACTNMKLVAPSRLDIVTPDMRV